jgi:pimeloyl-ACP methyl ester carboxylesterase
MDAEVVRKRKVLLDSLDQAVADLEIYQPAIAFDGEPSIRNLRRGRRRGLEDKIGMITLTEVDGVLHWEEGAGVIRAPGRRARRGAALSGQIVTQYRFEKLDPSRVGEFLDKLDKKLTPNQGLRKWKEGELIPVAKPEASKRALVFIHGTFSNNDNLFEQLNSIKDGRDLLGRALERYDEVLAFDHPTLGVSPILNAVDLESLFSQCKADVDVVAHSRGGLVARWWMEGFKADGRECRAVMVGAPLAGTSLAAPPKLRGALSYITNVGRALSAVAGAASAAIPFMSVAAGILKVVSSITSFTASTPLVDAAVAMIPGLAGQSRVGNNPELLRLRKNDGPGPVYFAVKSNFEPSDSGWAFLRRFIKWKQTAADLGADLVFESDNDLVVDTASMTDLSDSVRIPDASVYDFKTTDRVHHTNYFSQPETVNFIAKSLRIE